MSKSASKVVAFMASLLVLGSVSRANSLWPTTGAQRSIYADRKAGASGDIVTIVVAESAVATNTQTKKSERDSSVEDALTDAQKRGWLANVYEKLRPL